MTDHSIPPGRVIKRRHNLPHWEMEGAVYFITFRCAIGPLPPQALGQIKTSLLHDHGRRYELFMAVVMPDHVHLMIRPLPRPGGGQVGLPEILQGIKGASARAINKILGRGGAVWQRESFDRIVRDQEEFEDKCKYMWNNPVKAGLVARPEEWKFIVRPERPGFVDPAW